MPGRPFPGNTIFPVRAFHHIRTCETLKQGAEMETAKQMAKFFFRVCAQLRHVNTLSWLYVLWLEKMASN